MSLFQTPVKVSSSNDSDSPRECSPVGKRRHNNDGEDDDEEEEDNDNNDDGDEDDNLLIHIEKNSVAKAEKEFNKADHAKSAAQEEVENLEKLLIKRAKTMVYFIKDDDCSSEKDDDTFEEYVSELSTLRRALKRAREALDEKDRLWEDAGEALSKATELLKARKGEFEQTKRRRIYTTPFQNWQQ
jgi:exonuclease VII small subunit